MSDGGKKFLVREGIKRPDRFEIFKYNDGIVGDLAYAVTGRAYPGEFPEEGIVPQFSQRVADEVNSSKKEMFTSSGVRLFQKKQEFASTLQQQYVYDYRDKQIYGIRKKGFLPFFGREQLLIFKGLEREDGVLVMTADSKGARKEILIKDADTGGNLALVRRIWTPRVLLGSNSFEVSVYPGADEAFMLMLTVCIDEQYFEKAQ